MGIIMNYPQNKMKAFTMSYDDGLVHDIKLIEIMKKHGLKGTFNINSERYSKEDNLSNEGMLSIEQTKKLYMQEGIEVAVHTATHPTMVDLPSEVLTFEIIKDRNLLEKRFNTFIRGMANPNGAYNDKAIASMKACGIAYARTIDASRNFDIPSEWLKWNPTCHHNEPKLFELGENFINMKVNRQHEGNAKLFYLWGHSSEFEIDNNWDRIEKFAELIGGKDDIWYATNIEIYDYIKAFNQLIFNVEGNMCYNPTSTDLYFSCQNRCYEVKAGQTLTNINYFEWE